MAKLKVKDRNKEKSKLDALKVKRIAAARRKKKKGKTA